MNENENQGEKPMFRTIKSVEKEYGTRNFIEVALKETNNNENVFFSISKGFKTQNNLKRYKNSLGFAASEELQQFLVDAFKDLLEAYKAMPKKASAPEPSNVEQANSASVENSKPAESADASVKIDESGAGKKSEKK